MPLVFADPITIGRVTVRRPALFADCGATSPKRITLVDLDRRELWAEFCDVADPDCRR